MQELLHLFTYPFVQNAYLAGTGVALVAAVTGYFVVLRAQAFASEALADIGLTGAAGAAVLGLGSLPGMLCLTLLAALGMGALGERLRGRDIEIGMILAFALGLGVLFLTIYSQSGSHAATGVTLLFGSILDVSFNEVLMTFASASLSLLLLALCFRPLLFASVDPEGARARGVPVLLLSLLFLVLLALVTAEAVLVVGALLALALLVAPAAAAQRLARRPLTVLALALALALLITWGGLTLALIGPGRQLPAGFFIATLAALFYFAALLGSRWRPARRPAGGPHSRNEDRG
ncbi:MAG TPA: metal ABC transporter permease [Ktedonobacteraceae bacterium]